MTAKNSFIPMVLVMGVLTTVAVFQAQAAGEAQVIAIKADKVHYTPSTITLKKDQPVTLQFTSEDVVHVSRLSWKWRKRSAVKITEGTREKYTKAVHSPGESRNPEAAFAGPRTDLEVCDDVGLQPTVFYRWQKEFFENGAAAFQTKVRASHPPEQERIEYLTKKIQTKDEVLAELMAEHVALKKSHGEL